MTTGEANTPAVGGKRPEPRAGRGNGEVRAGRSDVRSAYRTPRRQGNSHIDDSVSLTLTDERRHRESGATDRL